MKFKIIIGTVILCALISSCEGCSRSGRKRQSGSPQQRTDESRTRTNGETFIVPMTKRNGVYEIPVQINGSTMKFIFDTGASDITISAVEAMFLIKQGTLSQEDVLGVEQYQIADGSISDGTIINLKSVAIGNKILYNVKATVINNMNAPLLLGQSALTQFGKVSIDYKKNELLFE